MCGGGLNSGIKGSQESKNLPLASTEKQDPNLGGLPKGGRQGPNICVLCMRDAKTISHLVICWSYAHHLWKDIKKLTAIEHVWRVSSVEEYI